MSRERDHALNIFVWDRCKAAGFCEVELKMVGGRRCHCFLAMLRSVACVIFVTLLKVRDMVKECVYRCYAL